jgi:hypothetical protein
LRSSWRMWVRPSIPQDNLVSYVGLIIWYTYFPHFIFSHCQSFWRTSKIIFPQCIDHMFYRSIERTHIIYLGIGWCFLYPRLSIYLLCIFFIYCCFCFFIILRPVFDDHFIVIYWAIHSNLYHFPLGVLCWINASYTYFLFLIYLFTLSISPNLFFLIL